MGFLYKYDFPRLKFKNTVDLLIDILTACKVSLYRELALFCDGSLVLDVNVIRASSVVEIKEVSPGFEEFRSHVNTFTVWEPERLHLAENPLTSNHVLPPL